VLGCDSLVTYSDDQSFVFATDTPKIWRTKQAVIGVAGACCIGQTYHHFLEVPYYDNNEEIVEDWVFVDFTRALREALEAGGRTNGEEPWTMLLGIADTLWMIDAGMGVHRCIDGIMAIGSGAPYLMGSLYTSKMLNTLEPGHISPAAQVQFALASADRYSSGTTEPFTILDNKPYITLLDGGRND